jgi:hypothetical protein
MCPEQRTIFYSSKFDSVNWGPYLSKALKNVVGRHLTTRNRGCVFAGLCMAGFFHPCRGPSNFIISSIQFKEPVMQGIRFCHSFDRWTVKLYTGQHHSELGAPKRQSCPQLTPAGVIPLFRNTPFSLGITLHLKKFTKIEILCLGGTPYRFCDSLEVFRGRRRLYAR